ncbi:hypothetical protein NDU88_008653 [Pleurodeles waltl]|uniref:Uncharacterized protein n=1 Tax=Pleurodeles waltl TaxID=8319 RepID=A0AAV7RYN6_PLEWA|nr:hypothetical protein NDU88_008653 [Pleurodeles waltl]
MPVPPHSLQGLSTSFLRPGSLLRSRAWRPEPVCHTAAGHPNEAGKPLAPRYSRHKPAPVTAFICSPMPGQKRLAHRSTGPAPRGGSSPRACGPRGPTSPLRALRGCRSGRGPTRPPTAPATRGRNPPGRIHMPPAPRSSRERHVAGCISARSVRALSGCTARPGIPLRLGQCCVQSSEEPGRRI